MPSPSRYTAPEVVPQNTLRALTGAYQPEKQRRVLEANGIPFLVRKDGKLAVLYRDMPGGMNDRPTETNVGALG